METCVSKHYSPFLFNVIISIIILFFTHHYINRRRSTRTYFIHNSHKKSQRDNEKKPEKNLDRWEELERGSSNVTVLRRLHREKSDIYQWLIGLLIQQSSRLFDQREGEEPDYDSKQPIVSISRVCARSYFRRLWCYLGRLGRAWGKGEKGESSMCGHSGLREAIPICQMESTVSSKKHIFFTKFTFITNRPNDPLCFLSFSTATRERIDIQRIRPMMATTIFFSSFLFSVCSERKKRMCHRGVTVRVFRLLLFLLGFHPAGSYDGWTEM